MVEQARELRAEANTERLRLEGLQAKINATARKDQIQIFNANTKTNMDMMTTLQAPIIKGLDRMYKMANTGRTPPKRSIHHGSDRQAQEEDDYDGDRPRRRRLQMTHKPTTSEDDDDRGDQDNGERRSRRDQEDEWGGPPPSRGRNYYENEGKRQYRRAPYSNARDRDAYRRGRNDDGWDDDDYGDEDYAYGEDNGPRRNNRRAPQGRYRREQFRIGYSEDVRGGPSADSPREERDRPPRRMDRSDRDGGIADEDRASGGSPARDSNSGRRGGASFRFDGDSPPPRRDRPPSVSIDR